jgi:tetratricopeptide (TPR) repeat protein
LADVFLAYAHEDNAIAVSVEADLKGHGITCWRDPQIIVGRYPDQIEAAIRECRVFVALLSKSSIGSIWVRDELSLARHYQRAVVPVQIDETPLGALDGVWAFVAAGTALRAYSGPGDPGTESLINGIQQLLRESTRDSRRDHLQPQRPHRLAWRPIFAFVLVAGISGWLGQWIGGRTGRQEYTKTLADEVRRLSGRPDQQAALGALQAFEQVSRSTHDEWNLQWCLAMEGAILCERGDLDSALCRHDEQLRVCQRLGNGDAIQAAMEGKARCQYTRKDYQSALAIYRRLLGELRGSKNSDALQRILFGEALTLIALEEKDKALPLLAEQIRVCREIKNNEALRSGLDQQGRILMSLTRYGDALQTYVEVEAVCRVAGDSDGMARAIYMQAALLTNNLDSPREGLSKAEEAVRVASAAGLTDLEEWISKNLPLFRMRVEAAVLR